MAETFDIADQGVDGEFDPQCVRARKNSGEYRSLSDCQSACEQKNVLSSQERGRIRSASFYELKSGTSAASRNVRFAQELSAVLAARRQTIVTREHHDSIVQSVEAEFAKELEIEAKFQKRKSNDC